MKRAFLLILVAACGNSSTGNESVGQVKKVVNKTPIICPDYVEVDLSLGVMRNGVGSLSKEDVVLAVDPGDKATVDAMKKAAEDGSIVKLGYDVHRISPCWPDHRLTSFVVETTPSK